MSLLQKIFHPHVPILSENTIVRYLSFSALYLANGIPHGITHFNIPAWMAKNGKTIGNMPLDEQARANGLMWGSKIIGTKFCWKKPCCYITRDLEKNK